MGSFNIVHCFKRYNASFQFGFGSTTGSFSVQAPDLDI